MRFVRPAGALGALAAVLVAGCGSSYTKSDFVARADAICAGSLREVRASPTPSGGLARYMATVLPIVESEASELRALRPPPESAGDRELLERYRAALAGAATAYRQLASAADRGDPQGVADAEAALRANPVDSLALSYGLRTCGSPGRTVG